MKVLLTSEISLSINMQNRLLLPKHFNVTSRRPGGEGGNDPPEGKFTKLGGKVNFGVLSSKLNVIRDKKGAISLFLTNKASFSC